MYINNFFFFFNYIVKSPKKYEVIVQYKIIYPLLLLFAEFATINNIC